MIGDLGLDPRPRLRQGEPRQHRRVAADLDPGRQQVLQRVGAGGIGVGVAIDVAARGARLVDAVEDLRRLAPIVDPRAFQMHDLDMDREGSGSRDCLLDRLQHPVRLVADMGEIAGVVTRHDRDEGHDLGGLGKAAGRGEQAGRQSQRAGAQPLVQQRAHLVEFGRGRGAVFQPHDH